MESVHMSGVTYMDKSPLQLARELDIEQAFRAAGADETTGDVRSSSLIAQIKRLYQVTVERALEVLQLLVEMGLARWSSFSTVRPTYVRA